MLKYTKKFHFIYLLFSVTHIQLFLQPPLGTEVATKGVL